jgi:hypothetical protein
LALVTVIGAAIMLLLALIEEWIEKQAQAEPSDARTRAPAVFTPGVSEWRIRAWVWGCVTGPYDAGCGCMMIIWRRYERAAGFD